MNKQYKPNIVRGGIAVPLGNNYYFMKGRKHKQGGIDVGKDLEVEDGEIMKVSPKEVKVFSAVPFLNGQSPVEKLLGGENPNKVFAQQERFKKVNKINDDGTKARLGKGKKITTTEIPESQQYAITTPNGQRKVFNNKEEAQQYITTNTPKGYSLYDTTKYGSNIDKGQTTILNRNTEREIEKATEQEELTKARLANRQRNQEIGKEILLNIPGISDANDIYQIGKDVYNKNYGNAILTAGMMLTPFDKLFKPIGKGIKKLFTKTNKKSNVKFIDNLDINKDNKSYEELAEEYADDWDIKQPDWDNIIKQIQLKPTKLEPINLLPKEKMYVPDQLDLEASERLNDFWNNIFMGKYASNRGKINKNKVFREPMPGKFSSIKSTDPEAIKGVAGHSSQGNAYIYSDINTINKDEIVIHEAVHNFRDTDEASLMARILNEGKNKSLLHDISTSNYTTDEINNLMNAYNFTDEYRFIVLKNDARSELAEKAATNTQLQYHLYNKYGVKSIDELNKVIDNLTDDDLLYDLMQTNGYGVNFVKDIATLSPQVKKERVNSIRQALKYVPATIGATTGLSLLSNNDQNVKRFGGKINKFRNGGDITPEEEALWKANNTVKPASNYHAAKDMYITKTREDFTDFVQRNFPNCPTGLSNCTLTVSQFYGRPIGRAHTIVTNPKENNLYPVNEEHAIPGTMVIASDPLGNINPKYHTMILSGYADKDYPFEYNGIKYNIKKGEPLVHYSKGKNNKESYKKNIPLRVYNDQSEGKTYNRYYRPYDKNGLPNVLLPELIVTNKKVMGGNHKLNTNQMVNIYRIDSNGKSNLRMNISTGDKTKDRQKAFLGTTKKDVKGNVWYFPTEEDIKKLDSTYTGGDHIYKNGYSYINDNIIPITDDVIFTKDLPSSGYDGTNDFIDVNRTVQAKNTISSNNKPFNTGYDIYNKDREGFYNFNRYKTNTNTNKKFVNTVTTNKNNGVIVNNTNKNTNKVNINTNKNINNEYKPKSLPSYFTLNGERLGKSTDNSVDIKPGVSNEFFVKTVDKNKLIKPIIKNNNIFKTSNDNKPKFLNAITSDYIGFGANALGNIASALINANAINKMKYNSAPIPKMSAKLKTNFNINPQLDYNREILHQGVSDIDTNTSSSNVGLNRKNQLRLANIMNTNKLYSTKENVETELINKDRLNQQNVANSNIDDYNKWSEKEAAFNNAKLDKLSENRVSLIQGLSQGVNNIINNVEKRKQFNNNLIAIMAANPNVNPRILKELGFEGITDEKIANWERVNKR